MSSQTAKISKNTGKNLKKTGKIEKSTKKTAKKTHPTLKAVQKRSGENAPYEREQIEQAVHKAMIASGEGSEKDARSVARAVERELVKTLRKDKSYVPAVEDIQDIVERELMEADFSAAAKAYILYREERSKLRRTGREVPEHVKNLAEESKQYFNNELGEFVYYRTYSRWIAEEGRRETWIETVDRYMDFMKENLGGKLQKKEYDELREAILKQEIMPSMRLMQFAGVAARNTNVCAYNCSYIAPSKIEDFAEVMYISMAGTGCGFSVEAENIQKLPQIKRQSGKRLETHVVEDSKEGWADALTLGLKTWFSGDDIDFDFTQVRPAGARLKTFGGKASGPEPLRQLLIFARKKIFSRQGKRLRNIDAHDILCMIGQCVVAGGVRRSAMISLSDLDDTEIRDAKKGQFWNTEPQRTLSNNSAVYTHKPSTTDFLKEWLALAESGTGERGIFNRGSLSKQMPKRRMENWRENGYAEGDTITGTIGTNPCGEIILRSKQFCNLSEVIARADDTPDSLRRKARLATLLGTYQSSLTYFPYLSKEWQENCENERLLGVSVTGQWDSPEARNPENLEAMKKEAIQVNKKYAKRFGINQSTCITCVKPSGTVSKTFDTSSGMHPRHAEYYIQRIRISATDALFKMLKDQGVPYHPEVGQTEESANTFVLEFPVKAPSNSIYKDDLTALEQLGHWKMVKEHYTEHNPSVTVSVGEDEWIDVASWLYENWDMVGGLSFLPRSNHVYQLAPYEAINKKTYEELMARMPEIDYSKIVTYEKDDETEVKKELACVAGVCDIDEILAK